MRRLADVASYPESAELPDVLYAGELEIRPGEGLVLASGQALTLSVREFELLVAMARRQGAIITREELYRERVGRRAAPRDRSVDVYVSKLRGKLEAALPDRRFIHTHPGSATASSRSPLASKAGSHRRAAGPDDGRICFHEMFTSGRPRLRDCAQHRRPDRLAVPRRLQHAIQPEET